MPIEKRTSNQIQAIRNAKNIIIHCIKFENNCKCPALIKRKDFKKLCLLTTCHD